MLNHALDPAAWSAPRTSTSGKTLPRHSFPRDKEAIGAELAAIEAQPAVTPVRQSSRLLVAWKDARTAERAKIASTLLAMIQDKDRAIGSFRPRPSWLPYFEELANVVTSKRETGLERVKEPSDYLGQLNGVELLGSV